MKRVIFCICFFFALFLLNGYSHRMVAQYTAVLTDTLEIARNEAQLQQLPRAAAALESSLSFARRQEPLLALFIRRETFFHLDEILCAALEYAQNDNAEETMAEIARAESQLYELSLLFCRLA